MTHTTAKTPGQVFRETLHERRAARHLKTDKRTWGEIPEADRADLEAAAQDAIAAAKPRWTERFGPVVACGHDLPPAVTREVLAGVRAHLGWIWRESADERARERADQALTDLSRAGVE